MLQSEVKEIMTQFLPFHCHRFKYTTDVVSHRITSQQPNDRFTKLQFV